MNSIAVNLDNISFSISPYLGHEAEILEFIYISKNETFDLEYLNWRYLGEKSPIDPIIFKIHINNGNPIGMCSLIFRKYLIHEKECYFAVVGDTSINAEYCGMGIGKKLLRFIKSYIEEKKYPYLIVLANDAFHFAANAADWITIQKMVSFAYVADLPKYFKRFVKFKIVANLFSHLIKSYMHLLNLKTNFEGFSCVPIYEFDDSFNKLWAEFPKEHILKCRDKMALNWKYTNHPKSNFHIYKILNMGQLVGYITYTFYKDKPVCNITDFIVNNNQIIKESLLCFIKTITTNYSISSIRIILNEDHTYINTFRSVGFVRRTTEGYLMTCFPDDQQINPTQWFVTMGDKDI